MPRFIVVAVLVAWLTPALAAPRDPSPVTSEAREHARQSFERGRQLYRLTQYAEALPYFVEAFKLIEEAGFIYNIAQCHRQLGHDDEALKAYESYLAIVSPDDETRADVEIFVRDLAVRIANRHAAEERARRTADEQHLAEARAEQARAEAEAERARGGRTRITEARVRGLLIGGGVVAGLGVALIAGAAGPTVGYEDAAADLRRAADGGAVFDASIEHRYDRNLGASAALFTIGGVLAVGGAAVLGRGLVERRILLERGVRVAGR